MPYGPARDGLTVPGMRTLRRTTAGTTHVRDLGHLVSGGRVACPRAPGGDVDVDRCYGCSALEHVAEDESGAQWVRCRPSRNLFALR